MQHFQCCITLGQFNSSAGLDHTLYSYNYSNPIYPPEQTLGYSGKEREKGGGEQGGRKENIAQWRFFIKMYDNDKTNNENNHTQC